MPPYNPYDANTNPYSTQDSVYGGAAGNGQQGSQTGSSATNAAVQSNPGGGKDAFSAFGNAAQAWARMLTPQRGQVPTQAPVPVSTMPVKLPVSSAFVGQSTATAMPEADVQPYQQASPVGGGIGAGIPGGVPGPVQTTPTTTPVPTTGIPTLQPHAPVQPVTPMQPPSDPNDLNAMAEYYRSFADRNPAFANITPKDVNDFRGLALAGKVNVPFGDWYLNQLSAGGTGSLTPGTMGGAIGGLPGMPGTGTKPPDSGAPGGIVSTTPPDLTGGVGGGGIVGGGNAWNPALDPTRTADPNAIAGPRGESGAAAGGAGGAGGVTGAGGDPESLAYLRNLMSPLWQQEQEDYLRALATAGGNSGAINSGAYSMAQSRGLADLVNQQQSGLAGWTYESSEAAKDRALQKALAEISGQYGIQAAQIGASTAGAGASAAADASKYASDIDWKKFITGLPYEDKWKGYDFQLGQDKLASDYYQYLLGLMGGMTFPPAGLVPNFNPTGYVAP